MKWRSKFRVENREIRDIYLSGLLGKKNRREIRPRKGKDRARGDEKKRQEKARERKNGTKRNQVEKKRYLSNQLGGRNRRQCQE